MLVRSACFSVPVDRTGATQGSTKRIMDLRLIRAQCGSKEFRAFLFFRLQQAEAFAQGKSYADVWDRRNEGLEPSDPRVAYWKQIANPYRTAADFAKDDGYAFGESRREVKIDADGRSRHRSSWQEPTD
jgi:hypothetical protein